MVMLAIAVFLSIVGDNMPSSSKPMALLSYYLMSVLLNSALVCAANIFNLRLYHKPQEVSIPGWLANLSQHFRLHGNGKVGNIRLVRETTDVDKVHDDLDMHVKSTQPHVVTWQIVAQTIDSICFVIFSLFLFTSTTVILVIITNRIEITRHALDTFDVTA